MPPSPQLKLKAQLQKQEQLVAKKSDLTAQIETLDREIKVCISILNMIVCLSIQLFTVRTFSV